MKYFCCPSEKATALIQKRSIFIIFSLLAGLMSCSTKLEVNAPYRETKVLYSILDPTLPYQTIRVSKGFLSDGRSAWDIAKNSPDSSVYNPANLLVELIEFKSGVEKRRWVCRDSMVNTKDTGVFYSPDQVLYKTGNIKLDTTDYARVSYKFRVTNKITGNVSEAVTNLPSANFKIIDPFNDIDTLPPTIYFRSLGDTKIRVSCPPNVEIAQVTLAWKVRVVKEQSGKRDTTLEEWNMNSPGICPIQGPEAQGIIGRGQLWQYIRRELDARGSTNVISRKFLTSRMDIYAGNKEYDNYRNVNGNYNAITQSLPIYSNVTNGGLGIVCSRNYRAFPVQFDLRTIDTLQFRFPDLKLVK